MRAVGGEVGEGREGECEMREDSGCTHECNEARLKRLSPPANASACTSSFPPIAQLWVEVGEMQNGKGGLTRSSLTPTAILCLSGCFFECGAVSQNVSLSESAGKEGPLLAIDRPQVAVGAFRLHRPRLEAQSSVFCAPALALDLP